MSTRDLLQQDEDDEGHHDPDREGVDRVGGGIAEAGVPAAPEPRGAVQHEHGHAQEPEDAEHLAGLGVGPGPPHLHGVEQRHTEQQARRMRLAPGPGAVLATDLDRLRWPRFPAGRRWRCSSGAHHEVLAPEMTSRNFTRDAELRP